jgi:hypothetical protein
LPFQPELKLAAFKAAVLVLLRLQFASGVVELPNQFVLAALGTGEQLF